MTDKTKKPETKELNDADLDDVAGGFTLNEELLAVKRGAKKSFNPKPSADQLRNGQDRTNYIGETEKN